ncbi:DNA polymerase-3 subunit chi [Sagittula marina]|uniref:DNA polymerase-3 subunit chi n=2 Tax=Roseobacteraceae TaxID=2854170 RepID=A0A7W6GRP9_9RHOB|nr:DNA polymerase-3 subunit chi [Sagittula marina]
MLLEKSLERGWRVAVRGTDQGRLQWLDQQLWLGREDGFLPHGVEGGPHDAEQPILLISGTAAANDPACLMAVDGADVAADEVNRLERVCILFNGHDADAVQAARGQWKALSGAGCKAQYWSEDAGRWEKKAEA